MHGCHPPPPPVDPHPPHSPFFVLEVATETEDGVGTPVETHGLCENTQITTRSSEHHNRLRHSVICSLKNMVTGPQAGRLKLNTDLVPQTRYFSGKGYISFILDDFAELCSHCRILCLQGEAVQRWEGRRHFAPLRLFIAVTLFRSDLIPIHMC